MSKAVYRFACLGGIYSNYLALESALKEIENRGVDAIYCQGDLGAFGPHPDRVFPLLQKYQVQCMQGNYDHSVGWSLDDCQCGYTDPRDNHFAKISFDYTLQKTSETNRIWMRSLPTEFRFTINKKRFLLCHGSPRKVNEFLWESTTSSAFLEFLLEDYEADVIVATHTGIHWERRLSNEKCFLNVGVLGRPENDGQACVWYTLLEVDSSGSLKIEFVPVEYDHDRLAREMAEEGLPEEFIETILTGWWTTCLEVLPGKERRRGKY
ncbi:Metallophosphoesterase [Planctomycetales bacterium 10988]|nr:Metallophosphoesterase [Planctomycetales bacterium 10988]